MRIKSVTIENYTDRGRWLFDKAIGRVRIEPGANLTISYDVWLRIWRRERRWIQKVGDGLALAHVVKKASPQASESAPKKAAKKRKSKAKPAPAIETPAATTVVADGNSAIVDSATTVPVVKKPLEEFPMTRVKEIAAGLGIKWEIGMSKAALIAAIREKRQAQSG